MSHHEVDGFTDSLVAYSRFQDNLDRYDAVISDVRMQGMSGVQLAKKLKEVSKDVQIFLMSAFEFNEDRHSDLKEIELKEFLQKPFLMQQLVSMVEKHIGQKVVTNSAQIGERCYLIYLDANQYFGLSSTCFLILGSQYPMS